jgi:Tfp pilus assembly protein PilX
MHAETHFGEQPRTCFFMGNQNGIAFVIALVMLLVLTMIGLASVNMSSYESNIAGNERVYNLSFYGADGGFENFRARIAQGEFIYTPVNAGSYQVTIGDVTCNISYTRTIYSNAGGTYAVFKVRSVGQPPFPSQGSVTVESVVQTPLLQQQ